MCYRGVEMEEVNLRALINAGTIKPGGQVINVPITKINGDGGKYDGQTYKIPLEYLYYNEQNGRIGSELSKYEAQYGQVTPGHNEEYNSAIQQMIVEGSTAAEKAIEDLKRDIGRKGQDIAGYVLNDGRVIDGNRRFTALRMLDQDEMVVEPQFFEAVLLDDLNLANEHDQALIKQLELTIQFGQLEKEDYDPIDRAIDAYKTVKIRKLMTTKQYAEYANVKNSEIDKRICEAELIVEFLKFINADEANYSIAKEMSLDGPLQDMVLVYRKEIKDSPEKAEVLGAIFSKLLQLRVSGGDFKWDFRQLVKGVIGSREQDDFVEAMQNNSDTIEETLGEAPVSTATEVVTRLKSTPEAVKALAETKEVVEEYTQKAANQGEKDKPLKLVGQAKAKVEAIDDNVLGSLDTENKEKLASQVEDLQSDLAELLELIQ